MEALNIAKPNDSLGSACSRPGMTAKAKTALRTLLFSIPTCLAQRSGRLHFAVTGTGTTSSLARPDSSSQKLCGYVQPFSPPALRGAREAEPP